MMLRTLQAKEYIRAAERGINRPVVLNGLAADGSVETIFVKTSAGYQNRTGAPGVELFTTQLARAMGMQAPEPVLVEIPEGFDRVVFDSPEHQALLQRSSGINFGTIALGMDWKAWPVAMPTRAFAPEMIEDILIFDALVQHTDRESDNPNLLWRDHEIAILDHEKCFGNLVLTEGQPKPWRCFLGARPLFRHCLRTPIDPHPGFGSRLHGEMIRLEFEERIPALLAEALDAFPAAGLDLDRIGRYFEALKASFGDFLDYLKLSLQP